MASWVDPVARVGYAAKGVVYALVGSLAVLAAVGSGGKVGGSKEAVETIGQQPLGQALLVATAIGMFAYAAWRSVQAILDPEREGTDGEGVAKRLGFAVSSLANAFLGITAIQMAFGGGDGGNSKKTWLAMIIEIDTVGPIIVGTAGVCVLAFAASQLIRGFRRKFEEDLKTSEMSRVEARTATVLGRVGLVARGVVFGIIGVYLIRSSWMQDASQAKTVGGSLREINQQDYGTVLLAVVASGLIAYAVLQLANARYRRIPSPA